MGDIYESQYDNNPYKDLYTDENYPNTPTQKNPKPESDSKKKPPERIDPPNDTKQEVLPK